ncbi:uncharacterized protein LOC118407686 [Branchiostoma floridae]|uniref:Uncharacterized protein LOC118407686 n=1 Tax=Branchiostoma floridae TaxID=7739 RepID=A0A9J7HRE0_BRAFL|nr:uncharacterized protein LOC118407686 [Branchiostoma floridae]
MAYEPKAVRGLGWAMVVLGSLSVTLGVAADINFSARGVGAVGHFISAPIWSGLLVLTTGILGVNSAKKPTNKCLIVASMVVGIFVILTCVCCIAIAAIAIVWNHYVYACRQHDWRAYYIAQQDYKNNPSQYEEPDLSNFKAYDCSASAIGLHATNIVLAVIEIILGFAVSIMSCVGLCTMRRDAGQTVIYAAGPVPDGTQGNIVIMQGNPGLYQALLFVSSCILLVALKDKQPAARKLQYGKFGDLSVQGSQPKVSVAQNPAQVPPAYQVDSGAAPGVQEEKKGPIPADFV